MAEKPSRPRDPNQLAKLIVDIATGERDDNVIAKDPAAVSMGQTRREGALRQHGARAPRRNCSQGRPPLAGVIRKDRIWPLHVSYHRVYIGRESIGVRDMAVHIFSSELGFEIPAGAVGKLNGLKSVRQGREALRYINIAEDRERKLAAIRELASPPVRRTRPRVEGDGRGPGKDRRPLEACGTSTSRRGGRRSRPSDERLLARLGRSDIRAAVHAQGDGTPDHERKLHLHRHQEGGGPRENRARGRVLHTRDLVVMPRAE